MGLTDQTLVVNCFRNFIEVSLPIFIHNLSHFNCTMGGWRSAKTEIQGSLGGWEEPSRLSWVSHSPNCLLNLQPFFDIVISLIEEHTVAGHKKIRMEKVWQQGIMFCRSKWTGSTYATAFIDFIVAAFAWKIVRAFSWYSGSVCLAWASMLMIAISEGKRNSKILYFSILISGHKETPLFS